MNDSTTIGYLVSRLSETIVAIKRAEIEFIKENQKCKNAKWPENSIIPTEFKNQLEFLFHDVKS